MLQPGDSFGDYRVLKLLGKGGMGSVFLLENAEDGQVAAKILDPATAGDHESRKRFLREAELALGVKHPNLIETYDVGEDPDTGLCYILMEYVSGGSLADYLKEHGALPVEDAVAVVQAMASVLELARQKGIVHRDIKPGNIMFDAEGTPKLADLGIARGGLAGTETTTVTQTGMMIGTPAYMAPEQMLDAHHVDCRADIYSLGVVFFEMLTGERPNKDDTVVQLMARAVKGEPLPDVRTLCPEVSASLAQLLAMMVAPDRDGRISTPGQITSALDIIERGGTIESDQAKTARREALQAERKRRRRRRRLTLVSALGAVALVGLVGIGLGVSWLMRSEGTSVETGVDSRPTTVVSNAAVSAAVKEQVAAPRVIERPEARTDSVRKSEPEVVERLVVVTNVVKEQTQADKKPSVPSEPVKEAKGVTDLRVRSSEVDGLTWFYTLEDGNAVIWRGDYSLSNETKPAVKPRPEGKVVVPAEVDGHKVTAIGSYAFTRCPKMTSIAIPEGVREIRRSAFHFCDALADVFLPQSLESIKGLAFYGCPLLKSVDIGKCSDASGEAFLFCDALEAVKVSVDNPSYVLEDGILLDRMRTKLVFYPRNRDVAQIPNGIRIIGEGAFLSCSIKTASIPGSVEVIGENAFDFCAKLREIRFDNGLQVVGKRAFLYCGSLRRLVFPSSLKRLGGDFVSNCSSLEMIAFRGDAPEFDAGSRRFLGNVPESLVIAVAQGTCGWNGPGSTDLPKMWPSGNFEDSRPIRYWRTEDEQLPKRPAGGSKKAAADSDRKGGQNPLAVGEPESGCWVDAKMPPSHRKLKPDLKSPECNLKGSHGIEVRADKGCSTAARRLLQNLRDWLTFAERIYKPPTRKKPFVITVSRCNPKSKKSAGYFLDVDTCELWLPPDDDNFESELQYVAAAVCTVCHETDWHPFVDYADRKLRQLRGNWYGSARAWIGASGIGCVFEVLEGECPDVFYRYQHLKHRWYAEGEIGSVIDYDTVADILSQACGKDVTQVMRRNRLGKVLRRKTHPPRAPETAVPPTFNDGKTFDIVKMTGPSFPKTLQKTLDAVFPPWRLGSDYQGAVKSLSGEVRTGRGTVRLGYLSKALDRSHVVVLPTWFNASPMTVVSCRRKIAEGEHLKCSMALGHGAANCSLAIRANGKDVHRMVLEEAARWYDFDVDLSRWQGKTPRIDVEVLSNRDEDQFGGSRGYYNYNNISFVNIQRLEFGNK